MADKWLDAVRTALENLGGAANLGEIYDEIERLFPEMIEGLTTWNAIVRRTIQEQSSDTESFRENKDDLFYSVDGLGSGNWGIRRFDNDATYSSTDSEEEEIRVTEGRVTIRIHRVRERSRALRR